MTEKPEHETEQIAPAATRKTRQYDSARRQLDNFASHCALYDLPHVDILEDYFGIKIPELPPPIDLEHFDAVAFNAWRERLGLSYVRAGEALGVTDRMAKYYGGAGKPVEGRTGKIPRTVALACEALEVRKALGR